MKLFKLSELSCLDGLVDAVPLFGAELELALDGPFEANGVDMARGLSLVCRELLPVVSCSALDGEDCGVSTAVDSEMLAFVGDRDDLTKEAHLKEGTRFTGLSAGASCNNLLASCND